MQRKFYRCTPEKVPSYRRSIRIIYEITFCFRCQALESLFDRNYIETVKRTSQFGRPVRILASTLYEIIPEVVPVSPTPPRFDNFVPRLPVQFKGLDLVINRERNRLNIFLAPNAPYMQLKLHRPTSRLSFAPLHEYLTGIPTRQGKLWRSASGTKSDYTRRFARLLPFHFNCPLATPW